MRVHFRATKFRSPRRHPDNRKPRVGGDAWRARAGRQCSQRVVRKESAASYPSFTNPNREESLNTFCKFELIMVEGIVHDESVGRKCATGFSIVIIFRCMNSRNTNPRTIKPQTTTP